MSGYADLPSPFPQANNLFNAASGMTTASVQNALYSGEILKQQAQANEQAVGAANQEQISRAASGLLQLPDEASRAAAYPEIVRQLQANGFARNAPGAYPGEQTLRALAMQGVPAAELYKYQASRAGLDAVYPGPGGGGGQSSAAPGGGSGGLAIPARGSGGAGSGATMPPEYLNYYREASAETGLPMELLIAQGRQESGFDPKARGAAGEIGVHQIKPSTATNPGYGMAGVDPATLDDPRNNIMFGARYLRARMGANADPNNPAAQAAGLAAYNGGGDPNYVANVYRYRPGMSPTDPMQRVTSYAAAPALPNVPQQASAAPPSAPGGGATPAPYQVASTAPTAPPSPPGQPQTPAAPAVVPPGPNVNPALVGQPVTSVPGSPQNGMAPPAPVQTAQAQPPPAEQPPVPQGEGGPNQPAGFQVQRDQSQQPQAPQVDDQGLTQQDHAYLTRFKAGLAASATPNGAQLLQAEVDKRQTANRKMAVDAWTAANPNIRATPVPGVDQQGRTGTWMVQGNRIAGFVPAPVRPAQSNWELQKADYDRDAADLPKLSESAQAAQANQVRVQKMRELVDQVSTGAGGNWRAAWANIAQTAGFSDLAKRLVGGDASISDPAAAAQEFAKLGLMSAGTQERGDLGARGSLGAINLYKAANPGLELRPDANKRILSMQLIAEQAKSDYATGALAFGNSAGDAFERGTPYTKLSHFDQEWTAQRNPQIYAAAMGALAGDGFDKWTAALNTKTPADVNRVLEILRRADPTAAVLWKDGTRHTVGQPQ